MIVLVVNNGSTSSRFSVIDISKNLVLANCGAEGIGTPLSYFKFENFRGDKVKKNILINNHNDALLLMMDFVFYSAYAVLNGIKDIDVIGHRVVHGGEKYTMATFISDTVIKDIEELSKLAPLHNKNALQSIMRCQDIFSGTSNVAVFDTAFHSTIPKENYLYAIPMELYYKYKIRKYGFHGISYNYVLNRYKSITNSADGVNVVLCHLGGGSSICSVKDGKSFDTTMGYTPSSGLIMTSRAGTIDVSILESIMKIYNVSISEAISILNNESGYLAICGEKDVKTIVERSLNGDTEAEFLRNMINCDFKKHLMSMMANLERVDAIVMTGGVGAKNKEQRDLLLSKLEQFGIILDQEKNNAVFDEEALISKSSSSIPIYVIPSNEEKEIADQCQKLMNRR